MRLDFTFKMQKSISFLIEKDTVLKQLHQQYGNPFIPSRPQGFVTLCKLILEQQVSIDSAKACFQKIEKLLGTVSPETILNCADEDLKSCGVSRQKNVYLKVLSKAQSPTKQTEVRCHSVHVFARSVERCRSTQT